MFVINHQNTKKTKTKKGRRHVHSSPPLIRLEPDEANLQFVILCCKIRMNIIYYLCLGLPVAHQTLTCSWLLPTCPALWMFIGSKGRTVLHLSRSLNLLVRRAELCCTCAVLSIYCFEGPNCAALAPFSQSPISGPQHQSVCNTAMPVCCRISVL
jgi:hypothetical protein